MIILKPKLLCHFHKTIPPCLAKECYHSDSNCKTVSSKKHLIYITWLTNAASVVESIHRTGVVGAVQGGGVDVGGGFVCVGTTRTVPPWGTVSSGLR